MNFLLVNPPVYDFAAYDLWSKPLGLLYISAMLKQVGHKTMLLDCLDRGSPYMPQTKSNAWGCGQYPNSELRKPTTLREIPRKYKRYGLPKEKMVYVLSQIEKPDYILVSSGMTYWYPGVFEAIELSKALFPKVPVILGGNYAALCHSHAKEHSGADYIVRSGPFELYDVLSAIGLRVEKLRDPFGTWPAPDYEAYENPASVALRTSQGCPFDCSYCVIPALAQRRWEVRSVETVVQETEAFGKRGVKNIAFYDDALLHNSEKHIVPILKGVIARKLKVSFHTPNGLHAKYVSRDVAKLMRDSGFVMPRISLETASAPAQKETGGKVSTKAYLSAVANLVDSGYRRGEYCAYLMMGMPGQTFEEIEDTLALAHGSGAHISLGEYSPIPGTRDWEDVKDTMPSDDPLWHNNSLFPLHPLSDWPKLQALKDKARRLNNELYSGTISSP